LYSFFFVGLFFPYGVCVGTFIAAVFLCSLWTVDMPVAMGTSVVAATITIFLLITMAAYQKELFSRQLFVSEIRAKESAVRQAQQDGRYIDWLRHLGNFLRHEVRQPVAQINSSIEIVQMALRADNEVAPYLTSAARGVKDVWNLVERASQATDAEAFVHRGDPRRMDLTQLVADQVRAHQLTNTGTKFTLDSSGEIFVEADITLMKEAVSNLLNNAASFALDESTISVSVKADDSIATVNISNRGPLIEGDLEKLFQPFASTRIGPSSVHQGIGLYLVRLIAENHGGTASLANMASGGGVEASITLPRIP
jgi:signal transduction histidine kinase